MTLSDPSAVAPVDMSDDRRFDDAWIFLSIGDAGGCDRPVAPDDLGTMADANNHAIPTPGELSAALASLTAAGLIAVAGEDVGLTEAGCVAYHEANTISRGHINRIFALADEWTRRLPPEGGSAT